MTAPRLDRALLLAIAAQTLLTAAAIAATVLD